MKIGVIGTGQMGSGLGTLLSARAHHEVLFGSRRPEKAEILAMTAGSDARAGTYADAIAHAEVVVMAVPWNAAERIVSAHTDALAGKILIDITNPILPGRIEPALPRETSAAETLQALVPDMRLVKAFNGVPRAVLDTPTVGGRPVQVFLCSDDTAALETVATVVQDLGFVPFNAGDLTHARALEGMGFFWLQQVVRGAIPPTTVISILGQ